MDKLIPYFKVNHTQKSIYDIELQNIDKLRKFSSVEIHVLVYPLSRKITADDIACNPFEEYVHDIKEGYDSIYANVSFIFNKILGLMMALIIFLAFLIFAPSAFLSIDSVVAIFAAYVIGKELGNDLEMLLINMSSKWRLQFYKDYFRYKLEISTTLTNYSQHAKKYRYGKDSILPTKMDFDKRSNSQIVRLNFKKEDLGERNNAHILSIRICDELANEFEKEGYMICFKICLNQKRFFFTNSLELFQSICKKDVGCLYKNNEFLKGNIFFKRVLKRNRIKFSSSSGFLKGRIIE